jgi:hypothetical protein
LSDKLIYIGDKLNYKVDLGKISSVDAINRTITSTKEATIGANLELQYSYLDIRFRLNANETYYSDWYNLDEFEVSMEKDFADVYVDENCNTSVEIEVVKIDIADTWDEDVDYVEVSNVTVDSTEVTADSDPVAITKPAEPSSVGNDTGLDHEKEFYYDPYDLGAGERMYNDLNEQVQEMWGHKVDYIKVRENNKKGKDLVLREWNLFNVSEDDIKCLKVIVPDNSFPDNNFEFNPYGMNYGEFMEIHITDQYFKKIYDERTIPQQYDYLYFPLVNRMYEVASSYLVRGFNMKPAYWKLTLTKYEKRANVLIDDTTLQSELDTKLKGLDQFKDEIVEESEDIINRSQLKLNDNDLDTVRNYIHPSMKYSEDNVRNYYTLISNYQYDLHKLWKHERDPDLAVSYKMPFNVEQDKASTITGLFSLYKIKTTSLNASMVLFSGSDYNVTLSVGSFHDGYQVGRSISLWQKTSSLKKFLGSATISSINTDRNEISCTLNNTFDVADVDLVSLTVERNILVSGSNEYDFTTRERNFTADIEAEGIKLFITESHSITLKYFGSSYTYLLEDKLAEDIWYAFVVSFNLRFRQLSLTIYEVEGNTTSGGMQQVEHFVEDTFTSITKTSTGVLNLLDSPIKLTNIRVFEEHLEADKHHGYLSRNLIDNDGRALVIDNALPNLDLQNFEMGQLR